MELHIWDFDSTMYHTPENTENNISLWEKRKGESWLAKGWWGNPESLNSDIFDIALNYHVYNAYTSANAGSKHYLVTGRLKKLQEQVVSILDRDNLHFDEVYCNPGNQDTKTFKLRLFDNLIRKHTECDKVYIYDDRNEHLPFFVELRDELIKELGKEIYVIDSKTMKELD